MREKLDLHLIALHMCRFYLFSTGSNRIKSTVVLVRQTDYLPRLHEKQVHVDRISAAQLLIDTKGTLTCPTPLFTARSSRPREVGPRETRKKSSRNEKVGIN